MMIQKTSSKVKRICTGKEEDIIYLEDMDDFYSEDKDVEEE